MSWVLRIDSKSACFSDGAYILKDLRSAPFLPLFIQFNNLKKKMLD
jgi:hypothetical protein